MRIFAFDVKAYAMANDNGFVSWYHIQSNANTKFSSRKNV